MGSLSATKCAEQGLLHDTFILLSVHHVRPLTYNTLFYATHDAS